MLGGGKAHPKQNSKLNKKVKILGITSALAARYLDGNLFLVKDFNRRLQFDEILNFAESLGIDQQTFFRSNFMFIDDVFREDIVLEMMENCSERRHQKILSADNVHCYDVVLCDKVILTVNAMKDLKERLVFKLQTKLHFFLSQYQSL